jgi:hypothetical protein
MLSGNKNTARTSERPAVSLFRIVNDRTGVRLKTEAAFITYILQLHSHIQKMKDRPVTARETSNSRTDKQKYFFFVFCRNNILASAPWFEVGPHI